MTETQLGTPDAQFPNATWVRDQLHAGHLTIDALALAAYCGHFAAMEVLERTQEPAVRDNVVWADGLRQWGPATTVRAAVALARHFSCDWHTGVGFGDLEQCLLAVEQWILCPCDNHRQEALDRRVTADGCGWGNRSAETIPRRATMKSRRAGLVAELAALAIEELAAPGTFPNFWPQLWQATLPFPWSKSKEEDARNYRAAIAAELIPWAIGFRDPVAERLADS
jgi:hypothetical protein